VNTPGPESVGRYQLLASALAGRLVEVAPVEVGSPSWTDGMTIFVDPDAEVVDVVRSVAVQASLLSAGSLSPEMGANLGGRAAMARRYLALEGHRALKAQEDLLPAGVCTLIDLNLAARTRSPTDSLTRAASREAIADPPPIFGMIRPRKLRPADERTTAGSAAQHAPVRQREEDWRELDDAGDSDGPVVDRFSSPVGGGGALGRLLKKFAGDARSGRSGSPAADAATRWSRSSNRVAATSAMSSATTPVADGVGGVERRGTTYPEWDVFRRRYRPEWCTVIEVDEERANRAPFELPAAHALRRPLARLGLDLQRQHRQLQGDDIDIDAAVEAFVESVAGSAPDEAVYIDSLRNRRDLSVLLLLDISGSAGEPGTVGQTVHEHQRAAAVTLTVTLHDLGDRVALYAFRSRGRSAVELVPVKRFGEGLDAVVVERIGALVPGGYTRMGAAIRHGAAVLEASGGTPRRLLVVLSDGFAYDHGYERAYGEADARMALAEARRRGCGCLCVSIGAGTDPDALRRVFGTAAHATLPREEQLADVIGPLFQAALRSAETQRRAWQRTERTRDRLKVDRGAN